MTVTLNLNPEVEKASSLVRMSVACHWTTTSRRS
jgi:hypothetical protein